MFVKVNGINMHYEVFGEGKPIILIHGNGEDYKIFDKLIEKLEPKFKVYAIDSRCHGESEDTPEISYSLMTDDVIAFIKAFNIEKPILYGFSDGGIVGLMVAIKRPKILSKLIISGAQLNPQGAKTYSVILDEMTYLFTKNKLVKLMLKEPDIKIEELKKITIPVHVLAGEKDMIKKKHTQLIAENIPNSTLYIVPGEDHGSYIIHNDKIYDIIKEYIKKE